MIDAEVAEVLRQIGHDVIRANEVGLAEADDADIMSSAIASNRLLITLDEDFGDWSILPLDRHPGVVRIKAAPATGERILGLIKKFLEQYGDRNFADHLIIVRDEKIRWIKTA